MKKNIIPVILAGGVGSRLWPLSREAHPKPFIKLDDGQSLLQKTYQRAVFVSQSDEIVTVTNRDLFFYTKDEFEEIKSDVKKNVFLLEPVGRNSAAAIAVAAQYALEQHGSDCILLIMPADHLIDDVEAFDRAVDRSVELALKGKLVTFGIQPTSAETGYGYIQADGNVAQKFVEKPDRKTAEKYLASGNYFWNSGIFCMSAGSFLEELHLLAPDIAEQAATSLAGAKQSSADNWRQLEIQRTDFERIQSISVDYAVFEKSQNVAVVPCDIGWKDIGSWNELGGLYPTDENQNNIFGDAICKETRGCIIHGGDRLVATLGVKDLVVADTADALLVAHKDYAQEVRAIVETLKSRNDAAYKEFPTVHRPWGTYTVLEEGEHFKIKRLEVNVGARLSLQSHQHRSEHWVVVNGVVKILNHDTERMLKVNESTFIPAQHKHCLENAGADILVIIEVQTGSYLGEDDIIRFHDTYGRAEPLDQL